MRCRQFLIFLLVPFHLSAQLLDEPESSQVQFQKDLYQQVPFEFKGHSSLYLFSDKSVYVPNEMVWFSAFEFDNPSDDSSVHPFYVMIADRFQRKPIWSGRFIQQSNFVAGSFLIPESIPDGNYALIAYADSYVKGERPAIFCKSIYVRSIRQANFNVLAFDSFPALKKDTLIMKYLVTSPRTGFAPGASVNYRLYADTTEVCRAACKVDRAGVVYIRRKFDYGWRYKNLNLVVNIAKDSFSKTEVLAIANYDQEKLPEPVIYVLKREDSDSLLFKFSNLIPEETYYLAIHNAKSELLYSNAFYLHNSVGNLKLPVDSFPEGYIYASLRDKDMNLLSGDVLVLRPKQIKISLEPDSTVYSTRSKVQMKIRCEDLQGQPVRANLSLSCALSRRVKPENEISRQYYKRFNLSAPVFTNYTTDSFRMEVRLNGKKPGYPVSIALIGQSKSEVFVTDKDGRHAFNPAVLTTEGQANLIVSVSGESPQDFSIEMKEPDEVVGPDLAKEYFPAYLAKEHFDQEDDLTQDERYQWKNTLQAAVVKKSLMDEYSYDSKINWVCACNHWRCDGCKPLSKPRRGFVYFDRMNNRMVTYTGEEVGVAPQKRLYIKKIKALGETDIFVPVNNQNSMDKEINTTLYWSPTLSINEHGEAVVTFYTNDLKGKFKIVLEGVSEKGPVHAEAYIIVK